jgi:parallel beta-helix repeat protein
MIAGTGVHTITPLAVLPTVSDTYTHITGYTQSGSVQGTVASRTNTIELSGNTVLFDGLNINANNTTISGLVINDFRSGINATIARNNLFIWGNYVGTSTNGMTGLRNSTAGINFQNVTSSYIGTNGDNINDANEGNLVSDNTQGIQIRYGNAVSIAGNTIGLTRDGLSILGNRYNGIYIRDATGTNVIGYDDTALSNTAAHYRNVSSGNGNDGVRLTSSSNQIISGNYLGTDVTGTIAIGNINYGVNVDGVSANNIIGTDADGVDDASETNVISGNGAGIRFLTAGSGANNRISGNYIGVDFTGNADLGNRTSGIEINGAYTGIIVGTNGDNINDAIERNVISGNADDGIRISNSNNHIIAGNYIGIGVNGISSIPNDKRGIILDLTTSNTTIGYSLSMANSNELIVGNRIKNNGGTGIALSGTGTQNRISRNQLENNGDLGIDLGYNGVTANDNGDGDTGANNLMNFPVITTLSLLNNSLTIQGYAPSGSNIEFFIADAGPSPNPLPAAYKASFGEGRLYLFTVIEGSAGDLSANTGIYNNDGTGVILARTESYFSFTIDVTGLGLSEGMYLTATATDSSNNTSEFSNITEILLNCGTALTNPHVMYYRRN